MIEGMNPTEIRILMERLGQKPIAFHPVYAKITGSINAALFLSQAMYWTSTLPQDREGWFYKTQAEWTEETQLSRREQETARKKLGEMGVLLEERRGIDPTRWFRVDMNALAMLIVSFSGGKSPKTEMEEPSIARRENPPSPDVGIRHLLYTENTAENTSRENTPYPPLAKNDPPLDPGFTFEVAWEAYPKKRSKPDALRAWKKLKPDNQLCQIILLAIDAHKQTEDWIKENGRFIPHFSTWLNNRRWEDEVAAAPPPKKPTHGII